MIQVILAALATSIPRWQPTATDLPHTTVTFKEAYLDQNTVNANCF